MYKLRRKVFLKNDRQKEIIFALFQSTFSIKVKTIEYFFNGEDKKVFIHLDTWDESIKSFDYMLSRYIFSGFRVIYARKLNGDDK
jgi:hypothetical protein